MEMSRRYQALQAEQIAASEALRRCEAECASLQQQCSRLSRQLSDAQGEAARLESALTSIKVSKPA